MFSFQRWLEIKSCLSKLGDNALSPHIVQRICSLSSMLSFYGRRSNRSATPFHSSELNRCVKQARRMNTCPLSWLSLSPSVLPWDLVSVRFGFMTVLIIELISLLRAFGLQFGVHGPCWPISVHRLLDEATSRSLLSHNVSLPNHFMVKAACAQKRRRQTVSGILQ